MAEFGQSLVLPSQSQRIQPQNIADVVLMQALGMNTDDTMTEATGDILSSAASERKLKVAERIVVAEAAGMSAALISWVLGPKYKHEARV